MRLQNVIRSENWPLLEEELTNGIIKHLCDLQSYHNEYHWRRNRWGGGGGR